jgi:hypothetical protein
MHNKNSPVPSLAHFEKERVIEPLLGILAIACGGRLNMKLSQYAIITLTRPYESIPVP